MAVFACKRNFDFCRSLLALQFQGSETQFAGSSVEKSPTSVFFITLCAEYDDCFPIHLAGISIPESMRKEAVEELKQLNDSLVWFQICCRSVDENEVGAVSRLHCVVYRRKVSATFMFVLVLLSRHWVFLGAWRLCYVLLLWLMKHTSPNFQSNSSTHENYLGKLYWSSSIERSSKRSCSFSTTTLLRSPASLESHHAPLTLQRPLALSTYCVCVAHVGVVGSDIAFASHSSNRRFLYKQTTMDSHRTFCVCFWRCG